MKNPTSSIHPVLLNLTSQRRRSYPKMAGHQVKLRLPLQYAHGITAFIYVVIWSVRTELSVCALLYSIHSLKWKYSLSYFNWITLDTISAGCLYSICSLRDLRVSSLFSALVYLLKFAALQLPPCHCFEAVTFWTNGAWYHKPSFTISHLPQT